jgi:peptidoglycan/LPS O-acetylase OafA/YrhL/CubicO group peptidase (beta-lactamase class C family)
MTRSSDRAAARQTDPRAPALPYLPGLDGLRALAVVAVLLYHADLPVRGGFLGVESFFVLSGFLITALLLAEWRRNGRIDLATFWARRARRLLPALLLVLAATHALATVLLRGDTPTLRGDSLAALGYVMNWHLIFGGQSYFDPMVRPTLLQHLWSLAVEEQFYLFWPLLFAAGMRFLRPRGLLLATLATAAASVALMAWLFQPGADPSRIYYGTDTRASALLIGVALALVWSPGGAPAAESRRAGRLLDLAGALALGGLIAASTWLYESHPLMYRGGFALVALGTALLIVAATHPRARLAPALLGCGPLRWIGTRSYAVYLWHWPIFSVTRPHQDVPFGGWPLLALRLAIVLALAELSYRFVETPTRRGAIERAWRAFLSTRRDPPARGVGLARWRRPTRPILSLALILTGACSVPSSAQPSPAATAGPPAVSTRAPVATVIPGTVIPPTRLPAEPPTAVPTVAEIPAAEPTAEPSAPAPTATPAFDAEMAAALQGVLDQLVADGQISGASLAVDIPGQGTWAGASGIRDRKTGEPMQTDTRVRIASISKMFTSVVVLQLAQEGTIDLAAPLTTWLPDLVPNGDAITVRNLLQHTSGLYDYLEDRNFVNQVYREPGRVWEPRELVEYAVQFPPAFRAGAKGAWDYSSTNYVLLGMIVEQATGNTLGQEVHRRIFEPLGLEQTYFAPDDPIQGVMSRGYSNNVDQSNAPMSFVFATANIVSTPSDVNRFARGLFGGELLEPAAFEQMTSFVNGKGQYKMPALEYGLGLMRNVLPVWAGPDGRARPDEASRVMGHIGGYGGFRSAV